MYDGLNLEINLESDIFMSVQIYLVIVLTFIIYVIGTLAYSVRIVAIKTGRIAVAFSVFNIFALISRMASTFQSPILTKTVEDSINTGNTDWLLSGLRLILLSATLATIFGALLMPTFIRIFSKGVQSFSIYRSVPKLLLHAFSKSGIEQFKNSITLPKKENISQLKQIRKIPKRLVLLNIIASSISTTGVLSAIYAGALVPEFRGTCTMMSALINGIATILLVIFVDPYISMLTDDVIRGKCTELQFQRTIIFIVCGLIIGTLLAQIVLVPAAQLIVFAVRIP